MNPVTEILGYAPAELRNMSENDLKVQIREYVDAVGGWEMVVEGISEGDRVVVTLDCDPKLIGVVGTVNRIEPNPATEEDYLFFRISVERNIGSETYWSNEQEAYTTWVTAVEHVTPVPPLATVEQADAFLEAL